MSTEKMHTNELFNDLNDFTKQFVAKRRENERRAIMGENPYLDAAILTLRTALAQIRLYGAQQTMHDFLSKKTGGC
jgi:hypothetical protein